MTIQFALFFPILLAAYLPGAEMTTPSYFRDNEIVATVGDSISAAGVWQEMAADMLASLRPSSGIRFHNVAVGGANAGAAVTQLAGMLVGPHADRPTLVLAMFGVNDTRWSTNLDPSAEVAYRDGLAALADLCVRENLPLVLLREIPFSKDQAGDAWLTAVDHSLGQLLAIQDKFAAARGMSVIDIRGAYRRALAGAWAVDPAMRFSPDAIHPTAAGHAAIATELIRACGGAAPGGVERGPLRLTNDPTLDLVVDPGGGRQTGPTSIEATICVHNRTDKARTALVRWTWAGTSGSAVLLLPAQGETVFVCPLPVGQSADLTPGLRSGRWLAPLAIFADAGSGLTVGYAPVWLVPVREQVAFTAADFHTEDSAPAGPPPLADCTLRRAGANLSLAFRWTKVKPVAAVAGFRNRYGATIPGELDLNSRDGQPCDAVEVLLDLRTGAGAGRANADADQLISGTARIGMFVRQDGTHGQSIAGLPVKAVTVRWDGDRCTLDVHTDVSPTATLGFAMRVTDSITFGNGIVHYLGGSLGAGHEPLSWWRIGTPGGGWIWRIGY